jgi:hypothetical protein
VAGILSTPRLESGAPAAVTAVPRPSSATACGTQEDSGDDISSATKLELMERVRVAVVGIRGVVNGPGSKLNKSEAGKVTTWGEEILAVVAALQIRLGEAELRAATAVAMPAPGAAAQPAASYASMLRAPRGREGIPIPEAGPVLAFYPTEEPEKKTAEDTKRILKAAVDPATIGVQVQGVRKIGNAG